MAILIEAYTVVVRLECIQGRLSHPTFEVPNSTALFDDHLWRCAFMAESDARSFLGYLAMLGMNIEPGPGCEAIVVDEFRFDEQPCEWLKLAKWEQAIIAWRAGTEPETIVAREGWDPQKGSGLTREAVENMDHLEFLEEKNGVVTFLNKETGQKVYSARTKNPAEAKFEQACEIIRANFVNPGGKPVSGDAATSVSKALSDLEQLVTLDPNWWQALWFHGKGLLSLGKAGDAYESFRKALALEANVEAVPRELAGVCLELGKFEEAVKVAELAVSLAPHNAGTVGNLALAQLLAGRLVDAKKTSAKALDLDSSDIINRRVQVIIEEVAGGTRPQPESLRGLMAPNVRKKPFWKFW